VEGKAAEAARIDEADLAAVGEGEDGVGVQWLGDGGIRDEQASGHSQVDQKLYGNGFLLHGAVKRHYDGFAYAPDAFDCRAGQCVGDFGFRRLEGLWLAAGPDAQDSLAVDARVDAVGDGFDFGKFGHKELRFGAQSLYCLLSMKIPRKLRFVMAGGVIAVAVAAAALAEQGGRGPMLLVANQADHTLSLLDPVAGKEVAAVPVGGITGHEVAASPDGKFAYVPIYGNSGVGSPGTDGDSMAVIDIAARKVVASVDFGHGVRPHMPLYEPVSGMLYVTTELDKAITVIDPKTLKIVGQIPTGQEQSHMLAISSDGKRGYTANVGPGTVSVLDIPGRKTIAVIPISRNIQRISVSRDGKLVFTADQAKPQMAVIDAATNTVKSWIPLPSVGYGSTPTLDGKWLLVAMPRSKQLAVIDLKTMAVTTTMDIPGGQGEILMRPDGKVAYVSCFPGHQVAEIDLTTWKVTRLIDAGNRADGLAWAK
jgi:DNA-binding beta-propeller fold protein YncE